MHPILKPNLPVAAPAAAIAAPLAAALAEAAGPAAAPAADAVPAAAAAEEDDAGEEPAPGEEPAADAILMASTREYKGRRVSFCLKDDDVTLDIKLQRYLGELHKALEYSLSLKDDPTSSKPVALRRANAIADRVRRHERQKRNATS